MKVVVQRVSTASVTINGIIHNEIGHGLLVLLGIGLTDDQADIEYIVQKTLGLRIFPDQDGKMNLSLDEIQGEVLLISQFTLLASTKKGNRPSYINAAPPVVAIPIYEKIISTINERIGSRLKTGVFGADMKISLINDGPVTIQIDSKHKD